MRPVPHLKRRPLNVFLAFWYESLFLFSKMAFHLFWSTMLARIQHGWDEPVWAEYFSREYLHCRKFQGRDFWTASWHTAALVPGHPASQQPAEQAWRSLKRGLASQKTRTHVDLADSVGRVMKRWTAAVAANAGADGKGTLSFMPDGEWSVRYPTSPCRWMVEEAGRTVRKPGGLQIWIPSIVQIVAKSRLQGGISVQRARAQHGTYLCMAMGKPLRLPPGLLDRLLRHLRAGTEEQLRQLWQEEGILERDADNPAAAARDSSFQEDFQSPLDSVHNLRKQVKTTVV